MVKINFGCFNSNIDGWIGVDHALRHIIISRIPLLPKFLWKLRIINEEQYTWHKKGLFKSVVYGEATRRLRFRDSTVDYIYSSHMLEHLWRDDAIFFLKECYRILKNEGIIRLCIPDWEELRNHQTFENSLFARNKSNLRLSHT